MNRDSGTGKRRSSFQNPQVLEQIRHIKDARPLDMMQENFPGFKLQTDTRLSGNSQRNMNSLGPRRSGLPEPTPKSGSQRSRPGSTTNASIRRSQSCKSLLRATAAFNNTIAAGAGAGARSSSQGGFKTASISKQSTGKPGGQMKAPSYSGLNTTRRKSISHESLYQTPSFSGTSRNRSRSRSPMSTARRRGGVINDTVHQKNIKVTKEKKLLAEMAKFVFECLDERGCVAKPNQWRDLMSPSISVATFSAIFKFLASHFVGDAFFEGTKGDAEIDRIIEVSKLLKYPGQLSKSHLKTATAPHVWPTSLTYVYWMACRVRSMFDPPSERNNLLSEFGNNGFEEAAFLSYLALFPLHFQRHLTEEHIAMELEKFTTRVCEIHAVECSKTITELEQEKQERSAELEKLRNEPNHTKTLRERLDAEVGVQTELREKIREVENQCKQFSNCNHLVLEQESIKMEIKAKEMEISRLRQQAKDQVLSKEQAVALQNETKNLKSQLESLMAVNEQLSSEYHNRVQKKESFVTELSGVCREFSIVERYNEIVRYLEFDESLLIPTNPFAPDELEGWMRDASRILQEAERCAKEFLKQINHSTDEKSKENLERNSEKEKLLAQTDELKLKLTQLQKYAQFIHKKQQEEQTKELETLSCANGHHQEAEALYNKALENNKNLEERHNEWVERVEEFKNAALEWRDKYKKAWFDLSLENSEQDAYLQQVKQGLMENHRGFYIDNYGIDIYQPKECD